MPPLPSTHWLLLHCLWSVKLPDFPVRVCVYQAYVGDFPILGHRNVMGLGELLKWGKEIHFRLKMLWHGKSFSITCPLWRESIVNWWNYLHKGPGMRFFGASFLRNWEQRIHERFVGKCIYVQVPVCDPPSANLWCNNYTLQHRNWIKIVNVVLVITVGYRIRADYWLAPSQWDSSLQSNAVTHRLGANLKFRADSMLAPSQCEPSLQSNAVSHWLGAYLESALRAVCGSILI